MLKIKRGKHKNLVCQSTKFLFTLFYINVLRICTLLTLPLLSTLRADRKKTFSTFLHRKGQKPNKNCQSGRATGETWLEYINPTVCREEAKPREMKRLQVHVSAWQIHRTHYHWDKSPHFFSVEEATCTVSQ